MSARHLLVVDGANVVGSRPDGWWRDRAGAAARLHGALGAALAAGDLPADHVVLVLEGRARPGVPEGADGRLETVHAPGSGDDEIVRQAREGVRAGDDVAVATSDRGLVERVRAVGAGVERPRRLLGLLSSAARDTTE